jgi:hypothetical protein
MVARDDVIVAGTMQATEHEGQHSDERDWHGAKIKKLLHRQVRGQQHPADHRPGDRADLLDPNSRAGSLGA